MVERSALESEIIRKCLSRSELQCSFVEYRGYKVVYRRYARYEFKRKKYTILLILLF
jgi:AP-4 complex subunit sigma-1